MTRGFVSRLLKVEPGEGPALAWSCGYFFCLLAAYYLLRPVRDALVAGGDQERLPVLYATTLGTMLAVSVVFSAITSRWQRRTFIPWAYRFFAANIVLFYVLLRTTGAGEAGSAAGAVWAGRVYYVWVSVFNLFVVSVFWSFMADIFSSAQGRRLFAMIAVGGSLGQVAGSAASGWLARGGGGLESLLIAAALLEVGCWCVFRLGSRHRRAGADDTPPLGGRAWDGLVDIARSGYLAGIAAFTFLYTSTSTFLYAVKITVAGDRFTELEQRLVFFSRIEMWTGVATVLTQVGITGRLMARFGTGPALALLPVVTGIGFALLALGTARPELLDVAQVILVFEPVRRACNFAVSRPAREVLYTVVPRGDKYKAKNAIDTFVYRTGDQTAIVAFQKGLAPWLGLAGACLSVVPIAAAWLGVSLWLGRAQSARARREAVDGGTAPSASHAGAA